MNGNPPKQRGRGCFTVALFVFELNTFHACQTVRCPLATSRARRDSQSAKCSCRNMRVTAPHHQTRSPCLRLADARGHVAVRHRQPRRTATCARVHRPAHRRRPATSPDARRAEHSAPRGSAQWRLVHEPHAMPRCNCTLRWLCKNHHIVYSSSRILRHAPSPIPHLPSPARRLHAAVFARAPCAYAAVCAIGRPERRRAVLSTQRAPA